MNDQESVNLSDDLGTIIQKKKVYHQSQLAFHQSELAKLEAISSNNSNVLSAKKFVIKSVTKVAHDKPWWWEKNIPVIVESFFPNVEFKNAQLMEAVEVPGTDDEEYRKTVRYAISVGLKANVASGFLLSRQEDGVKGYFYKRK